MVVIYELPNYVYSKYKKTKDNQDVNYELAQKKLSRNIALGKQIYNGKMNCLYIYKDMIIKTKYNKIVAIYPDKEPDDKWELHRKKFKKINKQLGIPMEV